MKSMMKVLAVSAAVAAVFSGNANAACSDIAANRAAIQAAVNGVERTDAGTAGFKLNMWATFVDETGRVCEVVTTGPTGALASRDEWLGSRVISAQKANTANAFSLNGLAISTGALYAAVQPGGSLFGLQESNPVDASVAYKGAPALYGTAADPLKGKRIGGVNVFGGGLALYKSGNKIGAIGVSGDTSCTDHAFAWKVREALALVPTGDAAPGGAGSVEILTIVPSVDGAVNGLDGLGQHPDCANSGSLTGAGAAAFGFTPLL